MALDLVGLVSLVLYPNITDKEAGYVMVMRDHLPPGWRGFLLAAFFAAYMSTISTQLNWGTSYIINDFYRRFVKRDGDERHYVWISRIATLVLMVLSAIVTFYLESIRQAWEFVLESGAGIGLVLILRWYWWRINAWSEIAAMVAAAAGYAALKLLTPLVFPYTLLAVVAWTTVCWLTVTLLTAPEPEAHLVAFYRRVRTRRARLVTDRRAGGRSTTSATQRTPCRLACRRDPRLRHALWSWQPAPRQPCRGARLFRRRGRFPSRYFTRPDPSRLAVGDRLTHFNLRLRNWRGYGCPFGGFPGPNTGLEPGGGC